MEEPTKTALYANLLLRALCARGYVVATTSEFGTTSADDAVVTTPGCLAIPADATWDANDGDLQIFNSNGSGYA